MTATLAVMMVEKGDIRWNSTMEEIFPDFADSMHAQWRGVTLEQLLTSRGGAPNVLDPVTIWNGLVVFGGMPTDARRILLEKLTVSAPASIPGSRHEYSNAGFSLAGHMLERVAGESWEEPLRERLFIPLEASFLKTHTAAPNYSDYAMGWFALDRPWGGGERVHVRSGSNNLWVAPAKDFAVIATCSIAGSPTNRGSRATDQAIGEMVTEFAN